MKKEIDKIININMSFINYLKEDLTKLVVTFDFDHTLRYEYSDDIEYDKRRYQWGEPNIDSVSMFRKLQAENDVYIVTTRQGSNLSRTQIKEFCKEQGLNPKDIIFTDGKDKVDTLVNMGSNWHFEDDDEEIKQIKAAGIKVADMFNQQAWDKYLGQLEV